MIIGSYELDARARTSEHIAEVQCDIGRSFSRYYESFDQPRGMAAHRLERGLVDFAEEQEIYTEFLNTDNLQEYSYDPNAFKRAMKSDCPIVRHCLHSPATVMDNYRRAFFSMAGADMLRVTSNIVTFAHEYSGSFSETAHFAARSPSDFGVQELDTEPFTAFGAIGGGIRSLFLHFLYPNIFPSRSQNAIWALYFLTNKKSYGLPDESEFLMVKEHGAQQNYFYPYDLFTYYARAIYLMLRKTMHEDRRKLDESCRYVYVDCFLNHVAFVHRDEINDLKPPNERFDY